MSSTWTAPPQGGVGPCAVSSAPWRGFAGAYLVRRSFLFSRRGGTLLKTTDNIRQAFRHFVYALSRISRSSYRRVRVIRQRSGSPSYPRSTVLESMFRVRHSHDRCAYYFLLIGAVAVGVSISGCGTRSSNGQQQRNEPSSPISPATPSPPIATAPLKRGDRKIEWNGVDSGYHNVTSGN